MKTRTASVIRSRPSPNILSNYNNTISTESSTFEINPNLISAETSVKADPHRKGTGSGTVPIYVPATRHSIQSEHNQNSLSQIIKVILIYYILYTQKTFLIKQNYLIYLKF